MSNVAKSAFVFGVYLVIFGAFTIVIPNSILNLSSLPQTTEVWVRVVGMLVLYFGIYYILAARNEMIDFLRWTLYLRPTVIVFFISFVLLDFASPSLIFFGVADLLGAFWTGIALRQQVRSSRL